MKKITLISFISIIIDQIIKIIVSNNMAISNSINIISNFFRITFVKNEGAAFSILDGNIIILILLSFIGIGAIYYFFIKNKNLKKIEKISFGLLIGGIIGNLIDRIRLGYVIDYLDFNFGSYNYPIFNFADICIVISVIILVISSFKAVKHEN